MFSKRFVRCLFIAMTFCTCYMSSPRRDRKASKQSFASQSMLWTKRIASHVYKKFPRGQAKCSDKMNVLKTCKTATVVATTTATTMKLLEMLLWCIASVLFFLQSSKNSVIKQMLTVCLRVSVGKASHKTEVN